MARTGRAFHAATPEPPDAVVWSNGGGDQCHQLDLSGLCFRDTAGSCAADGSHRSSHCQYRDLSARSAWTACCDGGSRRSLSGWCLPGTRVSGASRTDGGALCAAPLPARSPALSDGRPCPLPQRWATGVPGQARSTGQGARGTRRIERDRSGPLRASSRA